MLESKRAKQSRLFIGIFFAVFLILNAVFTAIAANNGIKADSPFTLLSADTAPAVRLLIFVIGLVISWLAGRMLYKFSVRGEIPVGDSTNISYVLLFYLLLFFAVVAFLGVLYWVLFPFFFLVLLVLSVIALWEVLGGLFTVSAVLSAFVAAAVTFYLIS